jgi:signal transduction histidine kinase
VQAHGGEVWVESGLGRGARFYLTLPSDSEPRQAGSSFSEATRLNEA